ncbi:MAG: helix-turn-helix domain-containing protein, partial [Lachnospiraceae bacterium]|nr:helix-turn-helix domain-containing protein [Lachnospiraceae bacterium]
TSFYRELPEEAVRFADEKNLPLFLFGEDVFTETIILTVGEVLEERKSILYDEQLLTDLLAGPSAGEVSKCARKFLNLPFRSYFIACLSSRNSSADVERVFSRIISRTREAVPDSQSRWIKYQNQILLVYSFPADSHVDFRRLLVRQLEQISESMEKYFCGLSEPHTELYDFDIALEQALEAGTVAALQQKDFIHYADIGMYQYLLPLLKNRTAAAQYRQAIRTLQEYDSRYHSELLWTLRCYVKNQGKLSATAEEMYQHVNTIRYRLGRVRELVQAEPFYEQIYIIVRLYELENT